MPTDPFYKLEAQLAIELPGARAVFTTAAWGDLRETRDAVAERLGVELAWSRQVHGNNVIVAGAGGEQELDADALLSTTPGLAVMVLSADCVPIVIAGGGVVAAVHAGWKGLREEVIRQAVEAIRVLAPGGALNAAIGPCAGNCCYEVSDELHETFAERDQDFRSGQNLDLRAIARQQLEQAGVEAVSDAAVCTICSGRPLLFSYRRDGDSAGRQGVIAWLT